MDQLPYAAKQLWAKKARDGSLFWLPLATHLGDCAAVARRLWTHWLPKGTKRTIEQGLLDDGDAEQLLVFLAAAHDIGKATPVFQAKNASFPRGDLDERIEEMILAAGLPIKLYRDFMHPSKTPHALATQFLLERAGCDKNVAVILGAHHGKPPSSDMLNRWGIGAYGANYHLGKEGKNAWTAVQQEFINFALQLAGFNAIEEIPKPNMAAQALLSGLVIMADWIASNERHFPYIRLEDTPKYSNVDTRAANAWKRLALPPPWSAGNAWMSDGIYQERFGFEPNAVQATVLETMNDIRTPGIFVLENATGGGKTEASLIAAEAFAYATKRSGIFFALPTQATSNGMFARIKDWIQNLNDRGRHSIRLAHGKAQFNEEYQALRFEGGTNVGVDEEDGAFVHGWFEGQKKSLLADFVVGTIDQLLLAALKQKHVMLRHLGLANKVVVIDECHAYDAYMGRYLERALRYLGAYQVPVIILSATLPAEKRKMVIDAYRGKASTPDPVVDLFGRPVCEKEQTPDWVANRAYPLITYTDGDKVEQKTVAADDARRVRVETLADGALMDRLSDLLSDGGCAGLVVNTVRRAQEMAGVLRGRFGNDAVKLLHSRFLAPDRARKETQLLVELGKPGADTRRPKKRIVVGTQVLEQSLDIDFDVLITDLCPMDLLLQRIGRLHRHKRSRPDKLCQALCLVLGADDEAFEAGAKSVYGKYTLMRAKALLPQMIVLPRDIPALVQDAYDDNIPLCPEPPGYRDAQACWHKLISDQEIRADAFRLSPPWPNANLVGWLNTDVPASDKHGEAAVRDTDESFEVLLVRKKGEDYCFLPWQEGGRKIPLHETPDDATARALVRQSIRLPGILCTPWKIEQTIEELEQKNMKPFQKWRESPWLSGELFLVLDENGSSRLGGFRLTYDEDNGLMHEKEGK